MTLLTLVSQVYAQGWSITANAPVPGSASASAMWGITVVSNSATLPAGPVAPGTFLTCSASLYGSSSLAMTWTPSVSGLAAPLAFTASSTCSSQVPITSVATTASGNAQIDLTLRAPSPVAGLLWVRVIAPGTPQSLSSSTIGLDLMADGSVEVSAQLGASSDPVVLPLQIPASGAVVRLSYNAQSTAPGVSQYVNLHRTIEALFIPNAPVVTPFATTGTGAAMTISHAFPGTVTLTIGPPPFTPALIVFGATPLNVPLLPTVTILVSPDILIANVGSITLPLPPLPSGTAIYAQGLVIDTAAVPRSTNSVRALWP
ncbi:MAG TPA: hypothetical protein VF384_18685 [Planctomycetota bacterium]